MTWMLESGNVHTYVHILMHMYRHVDGIKKEFSVRDTINDYFKNKKDINSGNYGRRAVF
jgi:hypothetical protein